MARIILLCTRDPRSAATGRITVLRTIIKSCRRLGHEVRIVCLDAGGNDDDNVQFTGHPSLARVLLNLVVLALPGTRSFNECLYYAPAIARKLKAIVARDPPDLVIADMIRTAQYVPALGVPWILDFDDLLSERYRAWASGPNVKNVLGYSQGRLPRVVGLAAGLLSRPLLVLESALLKRRERLLGRQAPVCCLVNHNEARRLSVVLGKEVHWAPMAMAASARAPLLDIGSHRMVFTGSMRYWPNLEAVRFFANEIGPWLHAHGLPCQLTVIGERDEAAERQLDGRYVKFLGFVEDLHRTLCGFSLFLAPIRSGSGIKTKVVEALTAGLIVAAMPEGVAGLTIQDRVHYYKWSSPAELADCLRCIAAEPGRAVAVAEAGRQFAIANFSDSVLSKRWERMIDCALRGTSAGQAPFEPTAAGVYVEAEA